MPNRTLQEANVHLLDGLDADVDSIISSYILECYLWTTIVGGVCFNLVFIFAIIRSRSRWKKDTQISDLMIMLFHLAFVDIGTLILLSPIEIWILRRPEGLWDFRAELCPLFMGFEVLLSLLTVYLLVTLCCHAVTVKRTRILEAEPINSGVVIPFSLVWMLAVSLSIPEFCLSGIVLPRRNYNLCTIVDGDFERLNVLHIFFTIFRVSLPVLILFATTVTSGVKLYSAETSTQQELYSKKTILKLSLVLSLTYASLSLPRSVCAVVHVFLPKNTRGPDAFREPPLVNVAMSATTTLVLSMLHYLLSVMRPILTLAGSRHFRSLLMSCSGCGHNKNRPR